MSATLRHLGASKPRLQVGGTLNPRRHLYIERPEDAHLLDLLLDGQYVNVLTSRQMGKSSLMVRTAEVLTKRGVRCAIVDLAAELGAPQDAIAYFLGLLNKIARDLKVQVDLPEWWAKRAVETLNQRLMRFFQEVVLEQVRGPVVCFLDEIDSTLKLPWTDDLFTALRGMHNERPLAPVYERLTFCLIGVAWPNELIKDRRTTPYNVGQTVELRDFDRRDDLQPLAEALGGNRENNQKLIDRILHWTGGHPYLTLRLSAELKQVGARLPTDVDQWIDESFQTLDQLNTDVHFQQILRFLEARLSDGAGALDLYRRILNGADERDQQSVVHAELKLSGLVKRDTGGRLRARNRIYARLFNRDWLAGTDPIRRAEHARRSLEARERLASLSISITSSEGREGTRITFPVEASQALLEKSALLLKSIGSVVELDLSGTKVTNLAPIADFSDLQILDLGGRSGTPENVQGQSPERSSSRWFASPPIAELAPLAALTNLQSLDLGGTQVVDAAPLAKLTSLQRLDLGGTQVVDLAPLANLTNLQWLNLARTQVADAAPLANLTNLQTLDLLDTQIADTAPLAGLTNLQFLSLWNTLVAEVATLAGLTNLRTIYLRGTQVVDPAPLANLTNLQRLDLDGAQVSQEQLTELKRAFAERGNRSVDISGP